LLESGDAMIRFVFRFFGLLLLALGFIFLVYDGTKSIADQNLSISTVGATWANIHQSSLSALQPVVERLAGPWFWKTIAQRYLLDQPASLVLAVIAAILILLGRKRKPLIGYARD
jgi:ABC-type phosphate transport system permease subunit